VALRVALPLVADQLAVRLSESAVTFTFQYDPTTMRDTPP